MSYIGNKDYNLEIAKGNIPGTTGVNKFGENPNVAADTVEDIWDGGGAYIFPTTADITHITQDVNQNVMTGKTIEVQGLDVNFELTIQEVTLNLVDTTTPVVLGTPLIRVFRMKVLADVVIDSDIRIVNISDTITYGIIQVGNNQTLMAIYTIPAGKTGYLTNIYASTTESTGKEPKSTKVRLWAADRKNGYEFQIKNSAGIPKAGSQISMQPLPYLVFTEQSDIKITAQPDSEIANVSAGFDLILVDNE